MDDLIYRSAAIEHMRAMAGCDACNNYGGARCRACTWDDAMDIVDELPAVDAVSVVHGRWIDIPDKSEWDQKMCSVCGDYFCCQNNYCPNCGAKMDGEVSKRMEGAK